jgi:hypothetical protein
LVGIVKGDHFDINKFQKDPSFPVDLYQFPQAFLIDLIEPGVIFEMEEIPMDGLEHSKGTVVRAEDFGNGWYVNGKKVAFSAKVSGERRSKTIPLIFVRGEIEITSIEFDDS